MSPLRVLSVASEVYPMIKTGTDTWTLTITGVSDEEIAGAPYAAWDNITQGAYVGGAAVSSFQDALCYRYEYDSRQRQIIKKEPGKDEVWMVYDARNRVVSASLGSGRTHHVSSPSSSVS